MGTKEQIANVLAESTLARGVLAGGADDVEVMKMCLDAAGDILETT